MHAIILAGGKGTRLRPLTYTQPKPLLPFMAEPYAKGLLRRLRPVGVDRASFLIGDDAGPFEPLVAVGREVGIEVALVTEERPLDTAGAARRVLHGSGERDVLVCNGDVLTDVDYAELVKAHHDRPGTTGTLALMTVEDNSSYGVVITDEDGTIRDFVEKPEPGTVAHDTVNAGAYVLDAEVFDHFDADGPLSFEYDVFPTALRAGQALQGVVPSAHWQDLGTPDRYLAGHRAVLDGTCAWPANPALEQPAPLVAVHRDADVAPGAELVGPVVVGADAVVEDDAIVENTVLHDGSRIAAGAQVTGAIIGRGAVVGERQVIGTGSVLTG